MLQTQQEVFLMSEDIVAELIEEVVDKIGKLPTVPGANVKVASTRARKQ
jgi:hypothetical protein